MHVDIPGRDSFYRAAKRYKYRARSAFKLLGIIQRFKIFEGVTRVVDLCAAPGSWSQVCSAQLAGVPNAQIVAIDLQPMEPIPGVTQIRGDITCADTAQQVIDEFKGERADLVISDGAPDLTGIHDIDEYFQSQLVFAAFNIACCVLREGGTFVAKVFVLGDFAETLRCFEPFFASMSEMKPPASRPLSHESFLIGQGFRLPAGYVPRLSSNPMQDFLSEGGICAAFVAFGDLNGQGEPE